MRCSRIRVDTTVVPSNLPSLADTNPDYVNDVLAVATGGAAQGDIGLLQTVFQVQGIAYLAGGLVFGVALFRARVLARWAAVLLAVGGLVSILLSVMPDAFYRFLPERHRLGRPWHSLWRNDRTDATPSSAPADGPRTATPAGAE